MRKTGLIMCALTCLGACSGTKEKLGLDIPAPDEFAVVKRAPLELPPNYALRPPTPGASRPQEQSTIDQAQATVFGRKANPSAPQNSVSGTAENALLTAAGVSGTPDNIRTIVDSEAATYGKDNQPVVDKLLGLGGKQYVPPESTLDPQDELNRLRGEDQDRDADDS